MDHNLTRANVGLGNPGGTGRSIRRSGRGPVDALEGGQAVAAASHANTARAVADVGPAAHIIFLFCFFARREGMYCR